MPDVLKYAEEFTKVAKHDFGLEDPFKQEREEDKAAGVYTHNPDGSTSIDMKKSAAIHAKYAPARARWLELKNEYIATKILRDEGYGSLLNSHYSEYLHDVIPCTGGDGQCHMDCPLFMMDNEGCGVEKSTHYI